MKSIVWDDGQGSRDRTGWAVLVRHGALTEFSGKSIPGLVAVVGESYKKAGKWSKTTYRMTVADDATFISGLCGWETGTMAEGVGKATQHVADSWDDLADALGATRQSVEAWIRKAAPRSAGVLDERAAALATMGTA